MLDTNITSLDSLSLAKASVKNLADTCSKENNVLKGTSVTPKENKQIERNEVSPFWEVGVVILALFVLAILKRAFSKKLDQYANALISNRFIGQLTREERSSESMSVILVSLTQSIREQFIRLVIGSPNYNNRFSVFQFFEPRSNRDIFISNRCLVAF
jgi:beta-lactamase regulating signal transducer with metallopeptidase domain